MNRKILILLMTLLLGGCSVLSPVKSTKMNTYLLNTLPTDLTKRHTHNITLLVMPPTARPIISTTQMAYSARPFEIAYFVQNQWAETPAQMLQPLLIKTLQQTHYFYAVVASPYLGNYNYSLETQILEFQQDVTETPNVIHCKIQVQLSQSSSHQIIATKVFSVTMPMTENTPYGGVFAANKAVAIILKQISQFCLEHMPRQT